MSLRYSTHNKISFRQSAACPEPVEWVYRRRSILGE
jgi:hypothetical protein